MLQTDDVSAADGRSRCMSQVRCGAAELNGGIARKPRPTIILAAGAAGCGKSTLACSVANELRTGAVLSTDTVRHILRGIYTLHENKLLFASTYDAGRHLTEELIDEDLFEFCDSVGREAWKLAVEIEEQKRGFHAGSSGEPKAAAAGSACSWWSDADWLRSELRERVEKTLKERALSQAANKEGGPLAKLMDARVKGSVRRKVKTVLTLSSLRKAATDSLTAETAIRGGSAEKRVSAAKDSGEVEIRKAGEHMEGSVDMSCVSTITGGTLGGGSSVSSSRSKKGGTSSNYDLNSPLTTPVSAGASCEYNSDKNDNCNKNDTNIQSDQNESGLLRDGPASGIKEEGNGMSKLNTAEADPLQRDERLATTIELWHRGKPKGALLCTPAEVKGAAALPNLRIRKDRGTPPRIGEKKGVLKWSNTVGVLRSVKSPSVGEDEAEVEEDGAEVLLRAATSALSPVSVQGTIDKSELEGRTNVEVAVVAEPHLGPCERASQQHVVGIATERLLTFLKGKEEPPSVEAKQSIRVIDDDALSRAFLPILQAKRRTSEYFEDPVAFLELRERRKRELMTFIEEEAARQVELVLLELDSRRKKRAVSRKKEKVGTGESTDQKRDIDIGKEKATSSRSSIEQVRRRLLCDALSNLVGAVDEALEFRKGNTHNKEEDGKRSADADVQVRDGFGLVEGSGGFVSVWFASLKEKLLCLEGYLRQSELIYSRLGHVINLALERGESPIVIEGVHLTGEFVDWMKATFPEALLVPFLVRLPDVRVHMQRVASRSRNFSIDPEMNKYIKNLAAIRTIQRFLELQSATRGMMRVDNDLDIVVGVKAMIGEVNRQCVGAFTED